MTPHLSQYTELASAWLPQDIANIVSRYADDTDIIVSELLQKIIIEDREPAEAEWKELREHAPFAEYLDLQLPKDKATAHVEHNGTIYPSFGLSPFNYGATFPYELFTNLKTINISGTDFASFYLEPSKFPNLQNFIYTNGYLIDDDLVRLHGPTGAEQSRPSPLQSIVLSKSTIRTYNNSDSIDWAAFRGHFPALSNLA